MTVTPTARLIPLALAMAFAVSPDATPVRADDTPSAGGVKLQSLKYDAFQSRLARARAGHYKYTLVDAWASNCGPCKENFPHLVEMHKKYAGKGLQVISLSFDDTSDAKAVAEARKFLEDQKSPFLNVLLDEEFGYGFEKFEVNAIPAVFVYDADGKLVKKFTLDDPNAQFTYDEVEKDVKALLDGKPVSK